MAKKSKTKRAAEPGSPTSRARLRSSPSDPPDVVYIKPPKPPKPKPAVAGTPAQTESLHTTNDLP